MTNNAKATSAGVALDTFSSTISIATSAFKLAKAPVHIQKVVMSGHAGSDVCVLKDAGGNVAVELKAAASSIGTIEIDFSPPLIVQGLQAIASDQTITSGTVYIYV